MILIDISELTAHKVNMEKISADIKKVLRERYPFVETTKEDELNDPELPAGSTYPGDREGKLLDKISLRASTFEELTVPETFELVEWLEDHTWLLEGGT